MIDNQDKQTLPLDLGEQPKHKGRPATGQALSNAERQRAYRERQKAQRNGNSNSEDVERLTKNFRQVYGEMERLKVQAVDKDLKIAQLAKQIELLKAELEKKTQRNEKTEKTYVCAIQKKSPKGQWRTVCKYETHIEGNIAYLEVGEGEMAHLYRIINLK